MQSGSKSGVDAIACPLSGMSSTGLMGGIFGEATSVRVTRAISLPCAAITLALTE